MIWNHNWNSFHIESIPLPSYEMKAEMHDRPEWPTDSTFICYIWMLLHSSLYHTRWTVCVFHALHRHKLTYMMQEVLSTDVTPERIAIFHLIIKRTFVVSLRLNSFYFNVGFRFDFTLLERIYRNLYMFCHVLTHLVFVERLYIRFMSELYVDQDVWK